MTLVKEIGKVSSVQYYIICILYYMLIVQSRKVELQTVEFIEVPHFTDGLLFGRLGF